MTAAGTPSEWETVIPKQRGHIFQSPYLEPASSVAQETGSDLEECMGCGQFREHVTAVLVADAHAGFIAVEVWSGWFSNDERIDWEDFIDRLAKRGNYGTPPYDFAENDSPAIDKIKRHIREVRRNS